jgi:hypothetical protein
MPRQLALQLKQATQRDYYLNYFTTLDWSNTCRVFFVYRFRIEVSPSFGCDVFRLHNWNEWNLE